MFQHVIKFLFSMMAEISHLKAGPLRTVFSLRSNDSAFGGFFACFGVWKVLCWGENSCLIVTTGVFLLPGHQVKSVPEDNRRQFFPYLFFQWEDIGEQSVQLSLSVFLAKDQMCSSLSTSGIQCKIPNFP